MQQTESRQTDATPMDTQVLSWLRRERIYIKDGNWFFRTREGLDLGPYQHREEAMANARQLARLHSRADGRRY